MRRYSNDLEMENGGTEVYEKGLHDERTGTVREDKELINIQERIEAWIHVYTLIMWLCSRVGVRYIPSRRKDRDGTGSDRGREGENERGTKPKVG